jgi:hypothetical protein
MFPGKLWRGQNKARYKPGEAPKAAHQTSKVPRKPGVTLSVSKLNDGLDAPALAELSSSEIHAVILADHWATSFTVDTVS